VVHVRRTIAISWATLVVLGAMSMSVGTAGAATGKGNLYFDGGIVRTVVVSAPVPGGGTDPLYSVVDGAPGQLAVAGTAPGAPGYRGGSWAVYSVTWNTAPYLLTSETAVRDAEAAGDVTVTRMPGADFRCPVQP
jgi:hypothetical protein